LAFTAACRHYGFLFVGLLAFNPIPEPRGLDRLGFGRRPTRFTKGEAGWSAAGDCIVWNTFLFRSAAVEELSHQIRMPMALSFYGGGIAKYDCAVPEAIVLDCRYIEIGT